jgi:hypothetical protein
MISKQNLPLGSSSERETTSAFLYRSYFLKNFILQAGNHFGEKEKDYIIISDFEGSRLGF